MFEPFLKYLSKLFLILLNFYCENLLTKLFQIDFLKLQNYLKKVTLEKIP